MKNLNSNPIHLVFYFQAAKLDPYCSTTFMYLGHYYHMVANDVTRAKKCYQNSFDLDILNDEAGSALCDLLTANGEEVNFTKDLGFQFEFWTPFD